MPSSKEPRIITTPVSLKLEQDFSGLYLPIKLGNKVVRFLVDTGACWTLMSMEVVQLCGLRDKVNVDDEGGLVIIGVLEAKGMCQGYSINFLAAITKRLEKPLLGMNFLLSYGCMLVMDPENPIMEVRYLKPVKFNLLNGVYKKCILEGHTVTVMLDTGSTHSFISKALAAELKLKQRLSHPMIVTVFDGSVNIMWHKVKNANITIDGLTFRTDLIIHPNKNVSLLLGMNILSGSVLGFHNRSLVWDESNMNCVGGKQDPLPSKFNIIPPLFSLLSASSRFITTTKRRDFPKWFKFLRWINWVDVVGIRDTRSRKGGGKRLTNKNGNIQEELNSEDTEETDTSDDSKDKKVKGST